MGKLFGDAWSLFIFVNDCLVKLNFVPGGYELLQSSLVNVTKRKNKYEEFLYFLTVLRINLMNLQAKRSHYFSTLFHRSN